MSSSAMRVAGAAAGVLLLTAAALFAASGAVASSTAVLGAALVVAAAISGRATHPREERAPDELPRLRSAALLCFSVAVGLYVFVLVAPRPHSDLVESAASLSAALWIVAMLLTFAFAIYAVRRRALLRHP